jgi:hypothetical protein
VTGNADGQTVVVVTLEQLEQIVTRAVKAALHTVPVADTRAPTLTPAEAQAEYGQDELVIRALVNDGRLRNVGNSRRYRVLRADLEAHLGITRQ